MDTFDKRRNSRITAMRIKKKTSINSFSNTQNGKAILPNKILYMYNL